MLLIFREMARCNLLLASRVYRRENCRERIAGYTALRAWFGVCRRDLQCGRSTCDSSECTAPNLVKTRSFECLELKAKEMVST
jgi:hypothetical protein